MASEALVLANAGGAALGVRGLGVAVGRAGRAGGGAKRSTG